MRCAGRSVSSGGVGPGAAVTSGALSTGSPLEAAQAALVALESLSPRTPAVESAIEEARNVLREMGATSLEIGAVRAELEASRILSDVRVLKEVHEAESAARREVVSWES